MGAFIAFFRHPQIWDKFECSYSLSKHTTIHNNPLVNPEKPYFFFYLNQIDAIGWSILLILRVINESERSLLFLLFTVIASCHCEQNEAKRRNTFQCQGLFIVHFSLLFFRSFYILLQPLVRLPEHMHYVFLCRITMAFERQRNITHGASKAFHGAEQALALQREGSGVIIRVAMDKQQIL